MTLDPVLLSRLQWTWVVAWHILLPAFTVGLASYIAVLEGLYLLTRDEIWFRISGFWTRIFAVSFGMGVVSGIIMPFQFGTNWNGMMMPETTPIPNETAKILVQNPELRNQISSRVSRYSPSRTAM